VSKFHQPKNFTPAPTGIVQRCGCGKSADATGECEECKAKKNAEAQQSIKSGGDALDASTRSFMESKFGQDFSKVRVHTDPDAAHASQKLGANAFTVGNDIAFAPGKYDTSTRDGKKLLAHELTHTLQQNSEVKMQLAEDQEEQAPQQQDVLEHEAKGMELAIGDQEEHPEDFEYDSDPALDGPAEITDDEAAALLEEADEQGSAAKEEEGFEEGTDFGVETEEESDVGMGDATQLALPPKDQRKRKSRKAKHKPADDKKKGPKRVVVNLGTQQATAFEGDKAVKTMKISSGRSTNPTDQGPTNIGQRDENHRSSKYGKCTRSTGGTYDSNKGQAGCKKGEKYVGAPMKYFQRFGSSAEGFHVGDVSKANASHGCVRLSNGNAKWLWDWAPAGMPVNIISGKKKASGGTKKKK
jgi:lipoprotein-anchoring transpeptidase ErfK/SrfK